MPNFRLIRALALATVAIAAAAATVGVSAQAPERAGAGEPAAKTIQTFGLNPQDRRETRTGPSRHRTLSGRIRKTRLVVWLIEGSDGMNDSVVMPTGLKQHKGSTAIDLVSKTLRARSQGLRMAFEVWRGNDVSLGVIAQPVGHVGHFDSGDDGDMDSVQAWLAGADWGTTQTMSNRKWHGSPDLVTSLKRALAGGPDSIIVVAGSMPVRPSPPECPENAELGEWVVERLGEWAGGGAIPQIHVLGIGLDGVSGAFFEKLASATLGTLTEFGAFSR